MFIRVPFLLLLTYLIVAVLKSIFSWFKSFQMLADVWIFVGLFLVANKIHQSLNKGTVVDTGIHSSKGDIPFETIKRIEGDVAMLDVIVQNNSLDISLSRSDLIKLSRYNFKHWSISGSNIKITPTKPEEHLSINYVPINKYRGTVPLRAWIFWGPVISWLFGMWGGITVAVLGAIYLFLISSNKPLVSVSLDDEGIHYKDDVSEKFIAFSQIKQVKNIRNNIMVSLNCGSTINLPRALELLEDFIIYYSQMNKPSALTGAGRALR